jgi:hypothetical protein
VRFAFWFILSFHFPHIHVDVAPAVSVRQENAWGIWSAFFSACLARNPSVISVEIFGCVGPLFPNQTRGEIPPLLTNRPRMCGHVARHRACQFLFLLCLRKNRATCQLGGIVHCCTAPVGAPGFDCFSNLFPVARLISFWLGFLLDHDRGFLFPLGGVYAGCACHFPLVT